MKLNVDYGYNRETYDYCAGVDWSRRDEQIEWCEETFKPKAWYYYHHQGAIYFKREKDLMLYRLRWTCK